MTQRIKLLQDSLGISENELSRRLGMSQSTLNSYTLGKRKPSYELAESVLATFVDISAEWLMRGKGEMYITDIPTGNESEEVLSLKAELTKSRKDLMLSEKENDRLRLDIEELQKKVIALEAQKELLKELLQPSPRFSLVAEEENEYITDNTITK